jgi:hypothetical protein
MPDYVSIGANSEATGAALTACEPDAQLIHRPKTARREVTPTPTTI